jgi:uncharacterized membrane protein YjgN (DUF898 family)
MSYHGTGQTLFALVFKNLLLTIVTLGCYLPWARTERRKYLWQNFEFDGHRLRYHGTGREMAFGYLKVALGYVVLLGIPAALARIDRVAGIVAQIVSVVILIPLLPLAIYGSRRYLLGRSSLRGVRFGLEPGAGGYLKVFVTGLLLTIVTFGIYGPVMQNSLRRYVTERSRFGSVPFGYDGENRTAWKISMKGLFLSVVTLGLYYPWFIAERARFRAESTFIQRARGRLDLSGTDVFWLLLVSVLGTILTAGIAFPWITTRVLRTVSSKLSFVGNLDYGAIEQRAASGDAAADGFATALDVGLEV